MLLGMISTHIIPAICLQWTSQKLWHHYQLVSPFYVYLINGLMLQTNFILFVCFYVHASCKLLIAVINGLFLNNNNNCTAENEM